MTNEQIRIAIAEKLGWEDVLDSETGYIAGNDETFALLQRLNCGPIWSAERKGLICSSIPNYPEDLNACHVMEKVLTEQQQADYADHLWHICDPVIQVGITEDGDPDLVSDMFKTVHITAPQRCEAFLRTFNLWKD